MSQDSEIRQGSIAEFMRKRTQLVGFDFGLNKHSQYAIEFVDNSLDAIESFQFKEQKKYPDNFAFRLKDDILLENLSYTTGGIKPEDVEKLETEQAAKKVDDEGYELLEDGTMSLDIPEETTSSEDENVILDQSTPSDATTPAEGEEGEGTTPKPALEEDEEAKELRKLQKKEQELEKEVQNIVDDMNKFIAPVQPLLEREPFVIVRVTESEAPSIYKDTSKDAKDVFQYCFEIFDNGTGMQPDDFEKYGKYLASSKSQKLKQTRGSQGFGASSAFSDAQNTTGLPITTVSKHFKYIYGTGCQFYTTSKNNKEYVVPPTEVECQFSHGTYIRLNYLNVKYKKGYIDAYIDLVALTNAHVTLIYIDPQNNEMIFPRRVDRFPAEPKYALPHPSSVNIGDFQDFVRSSLSRNVSGFLQDNFVRMSSSLAKSIVEESEEDLQDILKILILDEETLITRSKSESEPVYILKTEQRVYGKSKKPRDKLVVYTLDSEGQKNAYFEKITQYDAVSLNIRRNLNKINTVEKEINKEVDKKKVKELNKEIIVLEKEIIEFQKELKNLRKDLLKLVKSFSGLKEIEDNKVTDKMDELRYEVLISQAPPKSLTQKQTESLFRSFKNQKYMSPPTDTAIPIGSSVLETTLIKEYKLALSHRTDLFSDFAQELTQLSDREKELLPARILAKFKDPALFTENFNYNAIKTTPGDTPAPNYEEFILNLEMSFTTDEDFIAAATRPPTSGKGLAFIVEAAVGISSKIESTKTANQSLLRFVNRTPKMRDSSDCAIWKAVQSVNWKNYKVDVFDNGIPKGNLIVLVNISGPFVHLMFKSQSKNALAEDDTLMREIKFCLESIGRKIRNFENKKLRRETSQKRSKTIEKFIPIFMTSLMKVVKMMPNVKADSKLMEARIHDALDGKIEDTRKKKTESEEGGEQADTAEEESEEEGGEDEEGKRPKIQKPKSEVSESETTEDETIEEEDSEQEKTNKKPKIKDEEVEAEETEEEIEEEEEKPKVQPPKVVKQEIKSEVGKKSKTSDVDNKPVIPKESKPLSSDTAKESVQKSTARTSDPKEVRPLSEILSKATIKTAPATPAKPKIEITTPQAVKPETAKKKETKSSVQVTLSKDFKERQPAQKPQTPLVKPKAPIQEEKVPQKQPAPLIKPQTAPVKTESLPKPVAPLVKPKSDIDLITHEKILANIKPGEMVSIRDVIKRLNITDMQLVRYLDIKIKQLVQQKKLLFSFKEGKTFYRLAS